MLIEIQNFLQCRVPTMITLETPAGSATPVATIYPTYPKYPTKVASRPLPFHHPALLYSMLTNVYYRTKCMTFAVQNFTHSLLRFAVGVLVDDSIFVHTFTRLTLDPNHYVLSYLVLCAHLFRVGALCPTLKFSKPSTS